MKGLIIGDLAAWTWENDRDVFYRRLISEKAVLSEYGATAIAMVEPIWEGKDISSDYFQGHLQKFFSYKTELSDDVDNWLRSGICHIPFNKVNNLIDVLYAICGWRGDSLEDADERAKKINVSLMREKEELYASMILSQLIWLLRNGYSKKDVIPQAWPLKTILTWDKSLDSPLGAIARAWDAFYRAFDFTSTIHSAVKSPINPRLTACIAGALAEAMYGCDLGFLKKKYAGNLNGTSFQICLPKYLLKKYQSELSFMDQRKKELRLFFPKNCSRTNVERHEWTPVENIYTDKKMSYELRRRILKAFNTSFDDRYGFYLDDGWVYVYRSFRVLCRLKLIEDKNGVIRITRIEQSEEAIDYRNALMEAMYSVEHRWYLVSDEPAPENMQFCKYFKGEDECPEIWKSTVQGNFWHGEMMFVKNNISMERMKQNAENVLKQLKGEKRKKFLSYNEEQRAILVYIELMFGKWCPYDDLGWIWEY